MEYRAKYTCFDLMQGSRLNIGVGVLCWDNVCNAINISCRI